MPCLTHILAQSGGLLSFAICFAPHIESLTTPVKVFVGGGSAGTVQQGIAGAIQQEGASPRDDESTRGTPKTGEIPTENQPGEPQK